MSLYSYSVETNHVGEVFPGTRADIHKYLQDQGYVYDVTVGMREIPGPRAAIHKCLQDL